MSEETKEIPVVASFAEQIKRWVAGESVHADEGWGINCCPDFSCCKPEFLQPLEVRQAFQRASQRDREKMCMGFLGGMLTAVRPNVKVHIVSGDSEDPS